MNTTKRKVLLIAEAANPEWVSVPLVGWSMSQAIAKVCDAHIVTQIRNREAFLRAGLVEGRDFTAIDSELVLRQAWRLIGLLRRKPGMGWTIVSAISSLTYPYFEHLVWRHFGKAIAAGEYELVHRITPLTPTSPSSLAKRCSSAGIPFVLGPLNGGLPWPAAFSKTMKQEGEGLSRFRGLYQWLPGMVNTWRHSAAIMVGSRHTESEVPASQRHKCRYMPENGIEPSRFSIRSRGYQGNKTPLKASFVGRLVPYKGADMLIESAAEFIKSGALIVELIGDGPMLNSLRQQVADAGLSKGVVFHGWTPHEQVQTLLRDAQLMVLPSVREFGGGVVLEAMALGVVPVVLDYGGPGELVDSTVGFKIPIGTREDVVSKLRALLARILESPEVLPTLAEQGLTRVSERFTWDAKARAVAQIYEEVLSARTPTTAA